MVGLLCNWFDDWGVAIKEGLGQTWLLVLMCVFGFISLLFLSGCLTATMKRSIKKNKMNFKWGLLLMSIIFGLFTAWFAILM